MRGVGRCGRYGGALATRAEPRGQADGLLERARGGLALTDDVERGAVRGRGEHGAQTRGDRHATVEALQLGRDLALVVVHREHAVEVPGERLQEHGIRWKGAAAF